MNGHGRVLARVVPLAAAALLLGGSLAGRSLASFDARTADPGNLYAFTALYAPSSLTSTPSGNDVSLGWTAGGNGSGYQVLGVNNGTSSNCSSVSYLSIGSTAGTTYTDAGRSSPQGTWFCYQVKTSYGVWTSVNGNPSSAAQLGVVAATATAANGGNSGKLDAGDTITLTFNQPITTGTGPASTDTVCAVNGTTIMLASTTTSGNCGTGETVDLGTLTGGNSNKNARFNATYAWSNGNKTLTVTIGTRTMGGQDPNITGTWTFNPTTSATSLLSTTGSVHTCSTNAGGGNCLPTLGGSF